MAPEVTHSEIYVVMYVDLGIKGNTHLQKFMQTYAKMFA